MKRKTWRRLESFFNAKSGLSREGFATIEHHRYMPRATAPYTGSWRVFDRTLDRFLTDAEVDRLSIDELMTATRVN